MTDPTPTRAEVERYSPLWSFGEMLECTDGDWVSFTDYQALRERAEAAEADAAEWQRQALYHNKKHGEVITAARRAEAAAWNDAIEAAAETMANGDLMQIPDHEPWFINRWRSVRALRRAAPTGGET